MNPSVGSGEQFGHKRQNCTGKNSTQVEWEFKSSTRRAAQPALLIPVHFGSHNSIGFPSGSHKRANRPFGWVSGSTETSTFAARSCSTIALRSFTRKLTIQCCLGSPKYSLSCGNGANTVGPASWDHGFWL